MDNVSMEMPRYKCHKEVWALKIGKIEREHLNTPIDPHADRAEPGAIITPADPGYAPFSVDSAWMRRNPKVEAGGYFVVYDRMPGETECYTAYSPPAAFESGYSRV